MLAIQQINRSTNKSTQRALTALFTLTNLFDWHADDGIKRSASDQHRWLRWTSEEEKGHADKSWLFDLQETEESM